MKFIKAFRKAGEPTAAVPLYLCKQTRDQLAIWQHTSLKEMGARLKRQIEEMDRYEYLAVDEAGTIKAMMIIDWMDEETHTGGSVMFTKLAFSTEPGLLNGGYRYMLDIARNRGIDFIMTSRQVGPMEITHKLRKVTYES
ncbi:hypothetical protein DFV88_24795 [Salmonella enterica subsp. enterica serovar Newport]|nr:hypothetical protein [Salmonella enterica subsp. enterica serovar Newport]